MFTVYIKLQSPIQVDGDCLKSNKPFNTICTTYISSEHAAFCGFSSLCPVCTALRRLMAGIPEYGTLPQLNISQTVTPNDHYTI